MLLTSIFGRLKKFFKPERSFTSGNPQPVYPDRPNGPMEVEVIALKNGKPVKTKNKVTLVLFSEEQIKKFQAIDIT